MEELNYTSQDEMDCFEELNSLKIKYKEKLDSPLPTNLPVDFEKIEINKEILNELFGEVSSIVEKYSHQKIEQKPLDIKKLIEDAKLGDFISVNVLKPIFEKVAENLKDKIPSNWNIRILPNLWRSSSDGIS